MRVDGGASYICQALHGRSMYIENAIFKHASA
jgi:hypothetical protein